MSADLRNDVLRYSQLGAIIFLYAQLRKLGKLELFAGRMVCFYIGPIAYSHKKTNKDIKKKHYNYKHVFF